MAISFNTGATADSGGSQTTSQAITVPAGVLANDVVLVLAEQVTLTSTPSTFTASSTGTTPVTAGGTNNPATGTESLPAAVTGQVFYFVATGTDAGKVVTITASATGFWSVALVAYTGASTTAPVDVIQGAFGGAGSITVTCPTLSTGVANDWAVFLGGGAGENSTAVTPPTGSTLRESDNSSSQIDAVIADSNASVGAAGTSIGGGQFSSVAGSTNCILTGFTLGLAPPHAAAGQVQAKPPLRGRPAAAKGRLASILIKPPTVGGPPAKFFPPHVLLRGAAAAVKGKLTGARGQPGRPSPFRQPGPLRGQPAARPGRLTGLRGLPGQPSPFIPPRTLRPPPGLAVKGKLSGLRGRPGVPAPFTPPHQPLRGPAAARKGVLAGIAAPPPVVHPNVPAPFFPPHTLLRGQAPVRARTPLTGAVAPPPAPPPAHPPHWQGSTHMPDAGATGNLILGANHTGTGGPGDLKGDFERSGD